jgi:hypothetical protein
MPEKFVDEIEVNDFLVALIKIQNALHGGVRRGLLFLPLVSFIGKEEDSN